MKKKKKEKVKVVRQSHELLSADLGWLADSEVSTTHARPPARPPARMHTRVSALVSPCGPARMCGAFTAPFFSIVGGWFLVGWLVVALTNVPFFWSLLALCVPPGYYGVPGSAHTVGEWGRRSRTPRKHFRDRSKQDGWRSSSSSLPPRRRVDRAQRILPSLFSRRPSHVP